MDIKFLGGASEVGRSGILLKDEKNMLLDYGIKVSNEPEFPLPTGKVDAFFLSHAHLDHSGFAPVLYYDSFPVSFGTNPTLELSELLLEDSMKISRKQHSKPKYSRMQYKTFLKRYMQYGYESPIGFGEYTINLYDAGHVCGSAITLIEKNKNGKRLVYTGDFKITPQLLHSGAKIVKSDILITESTYGTRDHPDREELTRKFVEDIRETIDNNGTALLPVFAVGRAQEILAILYQNGLIQHAYIDGMAREATEIVLRNENYIKSPEILKNAAKGVKWIGEETHRGNALNGSSIIITTAGMLNGGPVLNYITKLNNNSKIFLTGYQVEGTNGRKLIEGKPITIDNRKYSIKTPVSFYDFSAHASRSDLFEYVRKSGPEKIISVHGDKETSRSFVEALKLEGFDAIAPTVGDSIKVDF